MTRRLVLPVCKEATPDLARRRCLLQGAALGLGAWAALGAAAARAAVASSAPQRIVTMNWELTESLLALGVTPVGISLPDWYRSTVIEPPLPPSVVDIGLLYQPNFDVLQMLKPDLFVITPGHAPAKASLQRLAPTLTLAAYMASPTPYQALCDETAVLAARLQRPAHASALIEDTARTAETVRLSLAARPALTAAPVLVADLVDDRHLRVYGRGSLFDAMLVKLGVANAAHPRSGPGTWETEAGFALVPLQRLVEVQQAQLLLVGPVAAPMRAELKRNAIWQALPAVRDKRVATLPVIAPYGGLISMQRFARAVDAALTLIAMGGGGVE